jgi:hypothetical protein
MQTTKSYIYQDFQRSVPRQKQVKMQQPSANLSAQDLDLCLSISTYWISEMLPKLSLVLGRDIGSQVDINK